MTARDFFDEPQAAETPRAPAPAPAPAHAPAPAPAPAPVAAASPPVEFHAVSEHDSVAEEAHKPVRRRRHEPAAPAESEPSLQMVETQAEVPIDPATLDEEPQRRTRPRRRRGGASPSEPLMMVETQPGAEEARPDNQP